MTPEQVIAVFRSGAASTAIGVALITIALALLAFALVGRVFANAALLAAASFAGLYGVRLIVNAPFTPLLVHGAWLPYVSSALEYLVPIPATLLVQFAFTRRLKRVNQALALLAIAIAVFAIPFEVATHRPFALKPLIDTVVVLFMPVFLLNLILGTDDNAADRRTVRWGSAVFVLFVLNEHFGYRGTEAIGFVIFVGSFILMLMRRAVRSQVRLGSVESELATARKIQMSIIPRTPPRVNGIDIATVYTPAAEVAGDFYDFLGVDDDHFGVLVADVSGHGVPAALVASMLKIALATQSAFATSPAALLANLHALFRGKLERQHITAAYAYISSDGSVVVASAGHPPPLIRRASGAIEEIPTRGSVLARFAAFEAVDVQVNLAPGDSLIIYTDGVTEALSPVGEMWGEERLREALSSGADVDVIARQVERWSGGQLSDDVTFVRANVK
ncbi:MAG TPA: PP2C family protein-serine/threonine phosphatase [Thermoanaerobaculia bacterium]|jgi:sigma-B regulation protein RsbU (phosphoserine phosphatase)|nr:PP2C family protein-serine/threonine phosphatase [Thermoanaerobaculia bacterium]